MILLDPVGPQTMFSILQADVRLVWKDKQPVATDVGIPIIANNTFESCPAALDVLFVPGGLAGSVACMNDTAAFARIRSKTAFFIGQS
jgi:cyclohexyl-isocyanide hydratase